MKASEVIENLNKLIAEHGDLNVCVESGTDEMSELETATNIATTEYYEYFGYLDNVWQTRKTVGFAITAY